MTVAATSIESRDGHSGAALPTVARERCHFFFDAAIRPVLEVGPSERVRLETWDCFSNLVTSHDQRFKSVDELVRLIGGFNPVAGPIYVRGAEPGDALAVHIESIEVGAVAPYAATVVVPGVGGLCSPVALGRPIGPDTRICPIEGQRVIFPTRRGALSLPVRPMIGTIGTAPAHEVIASLKHGSEFCGNVDCPEVTVGNTVVLPVNVEGALLSLGDVHAAMGDAEITGVALETSADVTIRVELIKRDASRYVRCPQIETTESIGSIACHFGLPLDFNVKAAFSDLVERLQRFHGFEQVEAYELLGAAGQLRVSQCVEGGWNSAMASLHKQYLPGGAAWTSRPQV